MKQPPTMKPSLSGNRGFSIVEVLTAAAILSISLIAIVAIVRKGTDIQMSVQHRQAARLILTSRLEERYGAGTYNMITAGTSVDTGIVIDPRSGTPLTGTLTTQITNSNFSPDGSTISIPFRQVTLSLSWEETSDDSDSLTITRWVVE